MLLQFKIPYCIEFHGGASTQNFQKSRIKKIIANYIAFNKFIKNASCLIYLNKAEKDSSIYGILNHSDIIIPNGIYSRQEQYDKPICDKVSFMYLGRIDLNHKGLDLLTDAIKLLLKENWENKIHFHFYGIENNSGDFIERIGTLKAITTYHGPIWDEDKFKAYEQNHIYVLTSRYEGMPVTVLEALSCGCPCLISKPTNLSELISQSKCGWVTNLSPDAIAHTIKQSYFDYIKNQKRLILNSINASKSYNWDAIINSAIKKYEQIIDENKSAN